MEEKKKDIKKPAQKKTVTKVPAKKAKPTKNDDGYVGFHNTPVLGSSHWFKG